MAQNQQMQTSSLSVQSQPSGTLEQEELHANIPLGLRTPTKDTGRKSLIGTPNQEPAAASGGPLELRGHQTLADRIKSRSRRSDSHSSAQVPSAAVRALADTIDAGIAPNPGASERYLDSRDADHNVPEDIPGMSDEQMQHREQPAATPQAASGVGKTASNDDRQQEPATPGQVKPKRSRKGSKAALMQTAAELAQSPDVSEDVLQEDEQVTKRRRSRKQLQVDDETGAALTAALDEDTSHPGKSAAKKPRQHKTKAEVTTGNIAATEAALAVLDSAEEQQPAAVVVAKENGGRKRQAATSATAVDAVHAAVAAVSDPSAKKALKRQKIKATEMAVSTETELIEPAGTGRKPRNRKTKEVEAVETDITVKGTEEGAEIQVTKKRSRARAQNTQPQFEMPTRDVLDKALQWEPTPRPVPNLGYACLCMDLREQKPPIFTNRDMVQKTFKAKGLPYVSELALENVKALKALVQWNHEHGIRFFRMTSNMLPWCTFYEMEDLPDFPAIAEELAFAGKLARAYQQRLTFHPSHFVKVAAPDAQPDLLQRSLKELEVHSKILDLMGYEPSNWNKVNIHIGGVYGDKESTLERFAVNFQQLSDNCKKRLTLENDDWGSAFSVKDLLPLSRKCNIPIVFDFHHHKFCTGGWTEKEAFYAALETWPKGVRPAVHWSESQEERRPSAHSDYIQGPMNLHGKERDVDVMIEAKCKERTLLRFRDETLVKQDPSTDLAMKFI